MKKLLLMMGLTFIASSSSTFALNMNNCTLDKSNFKCRKNLAYGKDIKQKLDIWLPNQKPKGLIVYFHGGGFYMGEKESAYYSYSMIRPQNLLREGLAFATVGYRLSGDHPYRKGVTGEIPPAMEDGARAIQFLRHHSRSLGLDKSKVAVTGGSAGGSLSLWISFHDDLKKTTSKDPVARQSTRVSCTAAFEAQSSQSISEIRELLVPYGFEIGPGIPGLFGLTEEQYLSRPKFYDIRLDSSYEEASAIKHLDSSDKNIKMLLTYNRDLESGDVHSPEFGIYLAEGRPATLKRKYKRKSLKEIGINYKLQYNKDAPENTETLEDFLINDCF